MYCDPYMQVDGTYLAVILAAISLPIDLSSLLYLPDAKGTSGE